MSNQKMKICYLADAASIHTRRWIEAFAQRGHEIFLVSFQSCPEPIPQVEYYHLPSLSPGRLVLKKLPAIRTGEYWFRAARAVRTLLTQIRPQLVHAHYVSGYGHLAALSGWRPYALTAWGSDIYLHSSRSLLNRLLTRLALKRAALITCDSQDLLHETGRLGAPHGKLHQIQFGVDLRMFAPQGGKDALRLKWGINPGQVVIFSPRSMTPHYNIESIVRSLGALKRYFPQAKLLLKDTLKEDPYRAYIQALIAGTGVEDCVAWIGFVPHSEMAELYNLADVVVSMAITDGTPVSVLEALACGAVVVASDLPSLREWIEDGTNGFLADPHVPEELVKKLVEALRLDPNQRQEYARINRSLIRAKGDQAKNMDRMENLYQNSIRAKSG